MRLLLVIVVLILASSARLAGGEGAAEALITIRPPALGEEFRNPVDPAYEDGFRQRYNALLRAWTREADGRFGKIDSRRYFESEKWSYPHAMLHVLAGNVPAGMAVLQAEDQPQSPRDNEHTLGIDLYPCFTLKGQVRKYFQFGDLMSPEYRKTFAQAIAIWTRTNPRTTPHPLYLRYDATKEGWGPNRFGNRQVDGRRTDNLYAMSSVASYLFAEASGNEATRLQAKSDILAYVWALYHIGHGEWDSTTYHPHVTAPYLSLYDFAKDAEVRLAAKLALDHFFTSAALKCQRLTFAGASKRDYGSTSFQGGEMMKFFWLYFPSEGAPMGKEEDQLHGMASAYRPPPAVIALAQRRLDLPVEILATKPNYENWSDGASDRPRSFETLFLARTYTAGTAAAPSEDDDMLPARIVFARGATGTNCLTFNSQPKINAKHAGDQFVQYRNLILWLRRRSDTPFRFLLAEGGEWQARGGRWFLDGGTTWFALTPVNLAALASSPLEGKAAKGFERASNWLAAQGDGPCSGFALELGEAPDHADFAAFVAAVEKRAGLVSSAEGQVAYTGTDGRRLTLQLNPQGDLPVHTRDGVARDWDAPASWALWRTVGDGQPVVQLGWKTGELTVRAGGHAYSGRFHLAGLTGASVRRQDLEGRSDLRTADCGFANQ